MCCHDFRKRIIEIDFFREKKTKIKENLSHLCSRDILSFVSFFFYFEMHRMENAQQPAWFVHIWITIVI